MAPLLSRSLVFELKPLSQKEILTILNNALQDKERGLGNLKVEAQKEALEFLSKVSDGDARRALSALEVGVLTTEPDKEGIINFDLAMAQESIQKKAVLYDRDEDAHYDTASAFIKVCAARIPMPRFIGWLRCFMPGKTPGLLPAGSASAPARMWAMPTPRPWSWLPALSVSEFVGLPECRIPLAQAAVYVACAPKSNAAYLGIEKATEDVEKGRLLEVPEHLKDASYLGAKKLGRGEGYKYAHDYKGHYVDQEYKPSAAKYYQPTEIGYEAKIKRGWRNCGKE